MKPQVTIEELSRLMDGEVTPDERQDIESRLATCPVSQALRTHFESLANTVAEETIGHAPDAGTDEGENCLDDDTLLMLAESTPDPEKLKEIESHLVSCRRCLSLVLEYVRTATSMQSGRWPDLPPEIQQKKEFRALVNVKEREDSEDWDCISIVVNQGITVSKTCAHENISAVVELKPSGRGGAEVSITAKDRLRSRTGMEIILVNAETRRKFSTGTTDSYGRFQIPNLPDGVYYAHFQGSELKIEIRVTEYEEK